MSFPCHHSPGRAFSRHWSGDFWGTRGISSDPLSPNAARWRDVPGASVDYPAAFGPKAHKPPELNFWPCPHVSRDGAPEHSGGTWKISSYPCLRNTVRFQDLPGASVDVASAFGFKAVRPPSSILVHARILSGTAFSRHGPADLGGI